MRTIRRTLALHPQIWGHRIEPFALPAELQAHFYELFEGEPRGSRMRYNTIAKTVPLALPAELQARKHEYYSDESRVCQGFLLGIPAQRFPLRGDGFHYTPSLLRRMISASSGVVVEVQPSSGIRRALTASMIHSAYGKKYLSNSCGGVIQLRAPMTTGGASR